MFFSLKLLQESTVTCSHSILFFIFLFNLCFYFFLLILLKWWFYNWYPSRISFTVPTEVSYSNLELTKNSKQPMTKWPRNLQFLCWDIFHEKLPFEEHNLMNQLLPAYKLKKKTAFTNMRKAWIMSLSKYKTKHYKAIDLFEETLINILGFSSFIHIINFQ